MFSMSEFTNDQSAANILQSDPTDTLEMPMNVPEYLSAPELEGKI